VKGEHLQLRYMTWPEIKEKLETGYDTIIISLGATEQHGPHLPECTDETIGLGLSCGLAERLGNTLVAPTIVPGLSEHHMVLPGSLTLRPETFKMVVEDYVKSYYRHGFRKFIFIASHGGNMDTTIRLLEELRETYRDVRFYNALTLDRLLKILYMVEKEMGMPAGSCGGHACAFETSLMLYLNPKHVKMDKAAPGYVGPPTRELVETMFKHGVVGISEIGVLGDPTYATRELGEKFFDAAIDSMIDYLGEQE
jgi:creatinine amidohydrolase